MTISRTIFAAVLALAAYGALAEGSGLVLDWREDALMLRDAERNENLFDIPGGAWTASRFLIVLFQTAWKSWETCHGDLL